MPIDYDKIIIDPDRFDDLSTPNAVFDVFSNDVSGNACARMLVDQLLPCWADGYKDDVDAEQHNIDFVESTVTQCIDELIAWRAVFRAVTQIPPLVLKARAQFEEDMLRPAPSNAVPFGPARGKIAALLKDAGWDARDGSTPSQPKRAAVTIERIREIRAYIDTANNTDTEKE